jgi:hypothetical protein
MNCLRATPFRARPHRNAMFRACWVSGIALLFAVIASAASRPFEIRSAFVEPADHVYVLSAHLDFDLPDGAQQAIQDGAALTLDLDITVNRQRKLWFDDTVASLEQRYEVVYHALTERYLVRNLNSGEQSWPMHWNRWRRCSDCRCSTRHWCCPTGAMRSACGRGWMCTTFPKCCGLFCSG